MVVRVNVTDAVRRLNHPTVDLTRLLDLMIKNQGAVKYDGSSWMHFASSPLLEAGVIESIDGKFMPGIEFESYLIEKNLSVLHSAFVKADRFGADPDDGSDPVVFSVESFEEAVAAASTSTEKLDLTITWLGLMADQITVISEAVGGIIQREFSGDPDDGL